MPISMCSLSTMWDNMGLTTVWTSSARAMCVAWSSSNRVWILGFAPLKEGDSWMQRAAWMYANFSWSSSVLLCNCSTKIESYCKAHLRTTPFAVAERYIARTRETQGWPRWEASRGLGQQERAALPWSPQQREEQRGKASRQVEYVYTSFIVPLLSCGRQSRATGNKEARQPFDLPHLATNRMCLRAAVRCTVENDLGKDAAVVKKLPAMSLGLKLSSVGIHWDFEGQVEIKWVKVVIREPWAPEVEAEDFHHWTLTPNCWFLVRADVDIALRRELQFPWKRYNATHTQEASERHNRSGKTVDCT